MRFSHEILIAAALIVAVAFALFTSHNDYLQRNAIRQNLENYLHDMGGTTATNISNWFDGRTRPWYQSAMAVSGPALTEPYIDASSNALIITAVVEAINLDITQINTLNQEGMENLQSTLRACTDLEQQATRLKRLVSTFKI